ncbi:hypothetical protein [Sphingomonas asaccharolytica]|uniref:hypothetical protein n=1 Tax=Sphingomonas asaccharolytica TaxID=40681 RepID=UPI0008376429|nr:hypothetical protein [Sphingomonas asaccharolytica]
MALIDCRVAPAFAWPAERLAAMGLIAYPLYIWHASIGAVVRASAASAGLTAPAAIIGFSIAAATAMAASMHVLVERPAMRRRDRPRSGARSIDVAPATWSRRTWTGRCQGDVREETAVRQQGEHHGPIAQRQIEARPSP